AKSETAYVVAPDVRTLAFKLEPDPWESLTDLQAFDAMVSSLGSKEILNVGRLSKNTARVRLEGDPSLRSAQVVETVAPNRLKWETRIGASSWKVIYDGTRIFSDGDKKKYAGTPLAQELEHNIRLFSAMRLPLLFSLILEKFDIKKGPNLVL